MNIKPVLLLVLVLAWGPTAFAQRNSAKGISKTLRGIRVVDFRNFTYRTTLDPLGDQLKARTIRLRNGKFEGGGKYEAGGLLYELYGKPAYGDVNSDGIEDAVVEIKLSGSPTYRAFEVYAYTFRNGGAKLLARLNSDRVLSDYRRYYPDGDLHYAGNSPPKIRNGHLIVEALTDGSFACPEHTAIFDYRLSGGRVVLSGKPVRKPFKCS